MLNYIRATGFAGYVSNDCFGYFLGDKFYTFFEVLQTFVLLEAVCNAGF
jgi:hypothetical protein